MKFGLFVVVLCLAGTCLAQNERDLDIQATGNITTSSLGTSFPRGYTMRQSNRGSAGIGVGYGLWRRDFGIVSDLSYTPTDSTLWSLAGDRLTTWHLDRYKMDALGEHRFRIIKRSMQPYVGAGGFVIVLWGGNAPAHSNVNASGWDVLGGFVVTGGIASRLTSRLSLKSGLMVDLGKASTYGDQTYRSSRNYMFEPQLGLTWRLGQRRQRY